MIFAPGQQRGVGIALASYCNVVDCRAEGGQLHMSHHRARLQNHPTNPVRNPPFPYLSSSISKRVINQKKKRKERKEKKKHTRGRGGERLRGLSFQRHRNRAAPARSYKSRSSPGTLWFCWFSSAPRRWQAVGVFTGRET